MTSRNHVVVQQPGTVDSPPRSPAQLTNNQPSALSRVANIWKNLGKKKVEGVAGKGKEPFTEGEPSGDNDGAGTAAAKHVPLTAVQVE